MTNKGVARVRGELGISEDRKNTTASYGSAGVGPGGKSSIS